MNISGICSSIVTPRNIVQLYFYIYYFLYCHISLLRDISLLTLFSEKECNSKLPPRVRCTSGSRYKNRPICNYFSFSPVISLPLNLRERDRTKSPSTIVFREQLYSISLDGMREEKNDALASFIVDSVKYHRVQSRLEAYREK
jgi:hypothetical protein